MIGNITNLPASGLIIITNLPPWYRKGDILEWCLCEFTLTEDTFDTLTEMFDRRLTRPSEFTIGRNKDIFNALLVEWISGLNASQTVIIHGSDARWLFRNNASDVRQLWVLELEKEVLLDRAMLTESFQYHLHLEMPGLLCHICSSRPCSSYLRRNYNQFGHLCYNICIYYRLNQIKMSTYISQNKLPVVNKISKSRSEFNTCVFQSFLLSPEQECVDNFVHLWSA